MDGQNHCVANLFFFFLPEIINNQKKRYLNIKDFQRINIVSETV